MTTSIDQTAPTIKSLTARNASKDARSAFNYTALLVACLPDGRFAICDRGQTVYLIIDDPPTRQEFLMYQKLLSVSRMAAAASYYGEPDGRTFARDLRTARTPPRPPRTSPADLDIEIDL